MKYLLALLFFAFARPAGAETIISPQEFEALSTGKTLYFTRDGRRFGAEQFYTRRRSTWQYFDGECSDGVWYAQGDLICFVYKGNPEPQCWQFLKTADGFVARAEGASPDFDITMSGIDNRPLDCKPPAVGV